MFFESFLNLFLVGVLRGNTITLRLLNALNSEDRGLKVRFSLATIAFDRASAQMSQILSSQGKNAPSNPYPHYLVRLATTRLGATRPVTLRGKWHSERVSERAFEEPLRTSQIKTSENL